MTSMKIRGRRPGAKAPVEWLLIEGLKPHASTLFTAGLKPCRPTMMPAERLNPWSATTSLQQGFPVEMCE